MSLGIGARSLRIPMPRICGDPTQSEVMRVVRCNIKAAKIYHTMPLDEENKERTLS